MAEKAEIEVIITPEGEVRLETRGLHGQACVAETKTLLPALRSKVLAREKTREYYQQEATRRTTTWRR